MKTKTEMPEGLTIIINGLDWEYNTDITVAENFDRLCYEINNSNIAKRRGLQSSVMTLLWDTATIMGKLLKANAPIGQIDVLCEIHSRLHTRSVFCFMPKTINLVAGSYVSSTMFNPQAPDHQFMQGPTNWSVAGDDVSGTSFDDILDNSDVVDWCDSPLSETTEDPLIKLFTTYKEITTTTLLDENIVDSLSAAKPMIQKYVDDGIIEQTAFRDGDRPTDAYVLSRLAV